MQGQLSTCCISLQPLDRCSVCQISFCSALYCALDFQSSLYLHPFPLDQLSSSIWWHAQICVTLYLTNTHSSPSHAFSSSLLHCLQPSCWTPCLHLLSPFSTPVHHSSRQFPFFCTLSPNRLDFITLLLPNLVELLHQSLVSPVRPSDNIFAFSTLSRSLWGIVKSASAPISHTLFLSILVTSSLSFFFSSSALLNSINWLSY